MCLRLGGAGRLTVRVALREGHPTSAIPANSEYTCYTRRQVAAEKGSVEAIPALAIVASFAYLLPTNFPFSVVFFDQLKKPTFIIIMAVLLKSVILLPKNSMCPILPHLTNYLKPKNYLEVPERQDDNWSGNCLFTSSYRYICLLVYSIVSYSIT